MRLRISFVFFLLFTCFSLESQVLDPFPDQVYIKENTRPRPKDYLIPGAFGTYFHFPFSKDSAALNQTIDNAVSKWKGFEKPPLRLADCVYFNDVLLQSQKPGKAFFASFLFTAADKLPPSLRFATDSLQDKVDSLSSLHLFPLEKPADYIQPFYFKKYEVTNKEYREFVYWVRDSLVRTLLALNGFENEYMMPEEEWMDPADHYNPNFTLFEANGIRLNWKTPIRWSSTDPDYRLAYEDLMLLQEERFFRRQFDTRKFLYSYLEDSTGMPVTAASPVSVYQDRNTFKYIVNVYPDTLCWVHNLDFPNSEAMTNMYFWHPKYDNYPVVGISWDQAKAFLNWKTRQEQMKLDAKGIHFRIRYALPSEIEWETAQASLEKDGLPSTAIENYPALTDRSWLTDLVLDSTFFKSARQRALRDSTVEDITDAHHGNEPDGFLREYIPNPYLWHSDTTIVKDGRTLEIRKTWYNWTGPSNDFLLDKNFNPSNSADSYFFTAPADLSKVKPETKEFISNGQEKPAVYLRNNGEILRQLDPNGISFMGGNVSEWLNEDYSAWRPAFFAREQMLSLIDKPDAQLEMQRELYFDGFNDRDGKLVRGANWFDERNSMVLGKNTAGANAKVFVDRGKDFATLGFRYVVHVYPM